MSLRLTISGFKLKGMQTLFGKGDVEIIEGVYSIFQKFVFENALCSPEEKEELLNEGRPIIERAVKEGVPFSDLNSETDNHSFVADVFAGYKQSIFETNSSDWKVRALWDFESDYRQRLHPIPQRLFSFLIDGRPIFGKDFKNTWSYYSYLSLEEVRILREDLVRLQGMYTELEEYEYLDGFIIELVGWLSDISDLNLDLWFFAS